MLRMHFIHDWRRKLNNYSDYGGTLRDWDGKLKKPLELDVTHAGGQSAFKGRIVGRILTTRPDQA
jgi:hypothetical protein